MSPHKFIGAAEIALMLGVSKSRAHAIANAKGFPDPIEQLIMGHLWERAAVEKWARERDRQIYPLK